MSECLEASDIKEIAGSFLDDFDRDIRRIPADVCGPFNQEASKLVGSVIWAYRATVTCVRREQDLAKVAARWESMGDVCARAMTRLDHLHAEHPYCGADQYFARLEDLRSKCQRLQEMHQ